MKELKGFNILLVDDEPILRRSIIRKINEVDPIFKVAFQAGNGLDALELLKRPDREDIHAVITDIRMPEMDGLKLAGELHKSFPELPVIVLSGYADFEYAKSALHYGVKEYLLKPVENEELESALQHLRDILSERYVLVDEKEDGNLKRGGKEIVETTISFLREHYAEELDIGLLAESFGFTSAYLTKLFHKYAGEPPLKYLTKLRIHKAKQLLSESDLTIGEIGEAVGYPDQFHFSKTFRKLTDVSPSAYRREARENKTDD